MNIDAALDLVIGLAHDYSLETRVRRLIESYRESGAEPRTLVMNVETWHSLVEELHGRTYGDGYFFVPQGEGAVTFFRGVPILIKDFVAYSEVLVGV